MKTAIAWLIIYATGLGSSLFKGPILALLTYIFTFYTMFTWPRPLGYHRWSLYAGIILITVYLLKKNNPPQLAYQKMPNLKWLIIMFLNMLIISPFAAAPEANQETILNYCAIITIYYLIVKIIQSKVHYKLFIYVQVWGCFLFGWQAYASGKGAGGRVENIGGPGTKGSNFLANHLLLVLPFLGNLFFFGGHLEKLGAIIASPIIVNGLILCNSRGALLAVGCMAMFLIFFSKKGQRKKMILIAFCGLAAFFYLANESVFQRMGTITQHEDDGSATSRTVTWSRALIMIYDYPFGKGGDGFKELSPVYIPEIVESHKGQKRSIHNSFLQVTTNWGVQGLIIFLLFIGSTIRELHEIRKRTGTTNDELFHSESLAIGVAIIGFLIAGIFGNRAFAEPLYWFCALATVLSNLQQSELLEIENSKKLLKEQS